MVSKRAHQQSEVRTEPDKGKNISCNCYCRLGNCAHRDSLALPSCSALTRRVGSFICSWYHLTLTGLAAPHHCYSTHCRRQHTHNPRYCFSYLTMHLLGKALNTQLGHLKKMRATRWLHQMPSSSVFPHRKQWEQSQASKELAKLLQSRGRQ